MKVFVASLLPEGDTEPTLFASKSRETLFEAVAETLDEWCDREVGTTETDEQSVWDACNEEYAQLEVQETVVL